MKTIFTCLVALLLALPALRAATLPSGLYRCTAELGAVLLDGSFPLTLEGVPGVAGPITVPGLLELSTAPNGALTGRAIIAGSPTDVKGTIKITASSARLTLRGKRDKDAFIIQANLQSGEFVGTMKIGRTVTPCRFDASATGAIRPECAFTLTVNAKGAISATGTMKLARQEFPLTARGRIGKNGVVSLTAKGGKSVSFRTATGTISGTTITAAKWTGKGYGALVQGTDLRVTKDP
jgi:hypothetical protein